MEVREHRGINYYLYEILSKQLFAMGMHNHEIVPYNEELLSKLRNIYINDIPASIYLLNPNMCNGQCFYLALVIAYGLEDCTYVCGTIRDLSVRFGKENADHCWIESNGWVYDPSQALKINKDLFYLIEHPQIKYTYTKGQVQQLPAYQQLVNQTPIPDSTNLDLVLCKIDQCIKNSPFHSLSVREAELFKKLIAGKSEGAYSFKQCQ